MTRIPQGESVSFTTRREFLGRLGSAAVASGAAAGSITTWLPSLAWTGESSKAAPRPKIAAVFTEFRFRSHTYNILENFLAPYMFRGQLVDPGCDVVSFYADQFPANDMARDVSKKFEIPLFDSIASALCRGGKDLAVDGVLLIGEHGDYPDNELGQKMYPRKEFFDQIAAVVAKSGRGVPVFNDKHLSYRWDWAKEMYDTAQRLRIPLMAGSSVPLAQRRPMVELPQGSHVEEAVAIHGGGMESYDFHGLELLQSFVENRAGGETGITSIELLTGERYQQAIRVGRWSSALVEAALAAERDMQAVRQDRPQRGGIGPHPASDVKNPGNHALVVTYRDGLQATVLKYGSSSDRWNIAVRLKGQEKPLATALFNGPWGNRCLFKALSHSIQHLFKTGQPPYPVERTLLVSGALDAAMHSHAAGKAIGTPHLNIAYQGVDFSAFRENGESWKRITAETPQPDRFEPGDEKLLRIPS